MTGAHAVRKPHNDDPRDTPDMPEIIGPTEAATILGVTPRTVVRWAENGDLPTDRRTRGGHRRFRRSVVVELLEQLRTADE